MAYAQTSWPETRDRPAPDAGWTLWRERTDLAILWLLRLGFILFVAYDGVLIVRNVTGAL